MQLDSRRGGSAQHILEWGIFGLVFIRKAGVLLLKDWQSQHIAERERERTHKEKVSMVMMQARQAKKKNKLLGEKKNQLLHLKGFLC